MAQIICLANSQKHGERCIAGIEISTGKWIRPVSNLNDGRIPRNACLVNGQEPKLMDILEIPLADSGNDFGFACENCSVLPGEWKYLDRVQPTDLIRYCVDFSEILHNSWKYVNPSYLQNLPNLERRTLQLVYVVKFSAEKEEKKKWRGTIEVANGQKLSLKITDPVFVEKLESGYSPRNPCLITVSLSMPYKPGDNWEGEIPCWKLIAGVIELPDLSNSDLILVEMMRVGLSTESGRSYLQETYNKKTRQELNVSQINEFLNYLKSL